MATTDSTQIYIVSFSDSHLGLCSERTVARSVVFRPDIILHKISWQNKDEVAALVV